MGRPKGCQEPFYSHSGLFRSRFEYGFLTPFSSPGNSHKNFGMRIDHLLVTAPSRMVWAEIDREAGKGKPIPSDHAPLVIDIDSPGLPFDAGRASAESQIAARLLDQ
jgi:hypothetical protein